MNRPELNAISFSLYCGNVDQPWNSTTYSAPAITTNVANRSSLHYSGPTPRSALSRCDRSSEQLGTKSLGLTEVSLVREVWYQGACLQPSR